MSAKPYEKARKLLLEHSIRPSIQRMAILEYLLTHRTHPTTDEIYSALSPQIPTLSRTTVYNTLSTLSDCGAILALDLDAGQMHYDGDTTPHAHFICTRCGCIHDVWPDVEGWRRMLTVAPPPAGASISSAQLSYKGICPACHEQTIH